MGGFANSLQQQQQRRQSSSSQPPLWGLSWGMAVWMSLLGSGGGSMITMTTTATTMVDCEAAKDNQEEEEEQEDPYDNLPAEDEPTHCSICLTYRQGPCRPYWRKVERCTKDHELKKEEDDVKNAKEGKKTSEDDDDEADEPPCLKYMLPWIDCASSYRNLYSLIELDTNYTAGIIDLEKEASMEACWSPLTEPVIDWTAWQEYVIQHPEWKLPKRGATKKKQSRRASTTTAAGVESSSTSATVSLWKTLDLDTDPELVDILAAVPTKQGDGGGILECAYAVDQDGNVLGFSYGTKPSEAIKEQEEANEEEEPQVTNEGGDVVVDMVELKIRLLPLRTRQITVAAAYTQPLPKANNNNDNAVVEPESHIFKSRPFSLKKMSKPN